MPYGLQRRTSFGRKFSLLLRNSRKDQRLRCGTGLWLPMKNLGEPRKWQQQSFSFTNPNIDNLAIILKPKLDTPTLYENEEGRKWDEKKQQRMVGWCCTVELVLRWCICCTMSIGGKDTWSKVWMLFLDVMEASGNYLVRRVSSLMSSSLFNCCEIGSTWLKIETPVLMTPNQIASIPTLWQHILIRRPTYQ